jgi:hypothetical protein
MPMGIGYPDEEKPKGKSITIREKSVTIAKPEARKNALKRKLSHIFPEDSGGDD